ncbi:MAG: hypothetical protein ACXVYV_09780, partial [Gaiellales bacterium]
MAKRRHSMRDGPLAQLFKATQAGDSEKPGDPGSEPPGGSERARPQLVDMPESEEYGSAHIPRGEGQAYLAVIRVVGVGGGGCNAINRMIEADVAGVEFIAVNTDIQQLQMSDAPVKIHIGREETQGLGSGS